MKKLLYILLFHISTISFAQDPVLFDTDWFLMELTVDGTNIQIPNTGEISSIPLNIELDYIYTMACNSIESQLDEFSNEHFIAQYFVMLPYNCGLPDTLIFEDAYYDGFFNWQVMDQTFNYVLEIGPNDTRMLTITNTEGDVAIYGNAALSIKNNMASQVSIYPNPAKENLLIDSKNKIGALKINIFSIAGKMLNTQKTNINGQTSIDVSGLKSGIYFLHIEDENGKKEVKKFIKE